MTAGQLGCSSTNLQGRDSGHFTLKVTQSQVILGFPVSSAGKEPACNAGDQGLIPGLGRSPREGKGYPLQYSGLENPMDCIAHGGHKKSNTTE